MGWGFASAVVVCGVVELWNFKLWNKIGRHRASWEIPQCGGRLQARRSTVPIMGYKTQEMPFSVKVGVGVVLC